MKLFAQIVRTVVNVAAVPVAVVRDVVTLGGVVTEANRTGSLGETYTAEALERVKREALEE